MLRVRFGCCDAGRSSRFRDSTPRKPVLGSADTREIRMTWLLTTVLVTALIVSSLRIGAWYLLRYDTGNRD